MGRWGEFWSCLKLFHFWKAAQTRRAVSPFLWCSLFPPARRCFQQGESDPPAVQGLSVPGQAGSEALARSFPMARHLGHAAGCRSAGWQHRPAAKARLGCTGGAIGDAGTARRGREAAETPLPACSIPLKRRLVLQRTRLLPCSRRAPAATRSRQPRTGRELQRGGMGAGSAFAVRCTTSSLPPLGSGGCPRVRLPRDQSWTQRRAVI